MLDTMPTPVLAPALPSAGAPAPAPAPAPAVGLLTVRRALPVRVLIGGAAFAAVLVAVVAAWAAGVRVFVVESPSMGSAAPVGSLVVGQTGLPAHVGDLITFLPPGSGATPYTHRIVAETSAGMRTRGDINGAPDPWTVAPSMVVSRVTAVLPGFGWLVKAAPLLLGALVVAQVVGLFVRVPAARWSIRTAAVAMAVAVVSWTMKPFSGFVLLTSAAGPEGMRATVVSTALLPIRIQAVGGGRVDLLSGQVGTLLVPRGNGGHVTMAAQLDLDPLGWVLVVLVCLLPVIAVLAVGVPVEERDGAA